VSKRKQRPSEFFDNLRKKSTKGNTMRLNMGLLALIIVGLSAPLSAQTSDWVVPGRHPFTGTPEQACAIHVARGSISAANCRELVAMQKRGECTQRQLGDNENLDVTFTVDGQHGVERKRVAFGSAIPINDPRRTATECKLQNGSKLVLPHVCGNWSIPVAVQSKPKTKKETDWDAMDVPPRTYMIPYLNFCGCVESEGRAYTTPGWNMKPADW
jgi:hypothetical protein